MRAGDISLGLIGVGPWGRNVVRTIAALPGMRLTAAASRNPETSSFVPQGCRIHADWQEIVAAGDIDGIVVATPHAMHAQILVAAVAANKAVLAEKPLVASRKEARQVRAEIGKRDATILVDHIHLFHPAFRELQHQAGALGPLRAIASAAGKPHGANSGSLLWDWGPHDLAMCMALAPGKARVTGAEHLEFLAPGEETIYFSLALAEDAEARVELNTLKPRHRWFAATFDDVVLVYRDEGAGSLVRLRWGDDVQAAGAPLPFVQEPPLRVAIAEFAEAIRRNDRGRDSFELGLTVVELIADIQDRLERSNH